MFIPIGDDNSRLRKFPLVVWIILGLNCWIWFKQLTLGESFTTGYSIIPYEITHGIDLTKDRSIHISGERVVIPHSPGPDPIYLTLISAMFMHGSWMHLLGNMLYLMIFGDQIEDRLGHIKFIIFYLICGLSASAAQILLDPASLIPNLGASGAIAGILGGYLILHPNNSVRVIVFRSIVYLPAIIVLGAWFALQFLGQFGSAGGSSGVAYAAHIGGFLAGLALISSHRLVTRR